MTDIKIQKTFIKLLYEKIVEGAILSELLNNYGNNFDASKYVLCESQEQDIEGLVTKKLYNRLCKHPRYISWRI